MKKWFNEAFFALHTDFHADDMENLFDKVDKDLLKEQLKTINPAYVQCDCKGHMGYTSYPTKIGKTAPYLMCDNLKIWREVTDELNLPLIVHYSGIWDVQAIRDNPSYARVNNVEGGELDENMVCTLSDYKSERMVPQMLEIVRNYNVDGFWVDGDNWAIKPCYCVRCVKKFKSIFGNVEIPTNENMLLWDEWLQFHRDNFVDYVNFYINQIKEVYPNILMCSNWINTIRQPEKVTAKVDYLSGDFDPVWSVAKATIEGRMMDTQNMPWNLMQWGITTYSYDYTYWTIKSLEAMKQEAAVTMSCGGNVLVYIKPMRNGQLVNWHTKEIGKLSEFVMQYKSYVKDTKVVPQIGILHAKEHFYKNNLPSFDLGKYVTKPIEGAMALCLENGFSASVITTDELMDNINRYPVLIIAEQENLTNEIKNRVLEYVNNGGKLLVLGSSTTLFDDVMAVREIGILGDNINCTKNTSAVARESEQLSVGDRTIPAIGQWRKIRYNDNAANPLSFILYDYGRKSQENKTQYPADLYKKVGNGEMIAVYGQICSGYANAHYAPYREIFARYMEELSATLVKAKSPAYINMSVRQRENKVFIHLVNTSSDFPLSATNNYVENVPLCGSFCVEYPCETIPKNAVLRPNNEVLRTSYCSNILKIYVEKLHIYSIIELEF